MMTIAERFTFIRKQNKISANKLSKALNIDPSTISKIENGSAMPSIQLLQKFCNYFDISLSGFFKPFDNSLETMNEPPSIYNHIMLAPELMELIESAKDLSPEQVKLFAKLMQTMK